MGQEVLVDRYLRAVDLGQPGLLPLDRIGLTPRLAAPQDQQVGHHPCPGGSLMRPAGQPDRPD